MPDSSPDADLPFGETLVREGLAKREQVEESLRVRARLASRGVRPVPGLGEILLKKGYLTREQLAQAKTLAARSGAANSAAALPGDLSAGALAKAEAAEAARDPANTVGKYLRVAKLGAGGMGEVWKAWDTELGRWVALKFLKGQYTDDVARFRREAQTAGKLNHPGIAAVYEARENYIAMQFVEGQTLESFPRDDRRLLAELMRDAAIAVHALHAAGVIHRDLKPSNIMVEGKPGPRRKTARRAPVPSGAAGLRVYVMDFGLAKPMSVDSSLSQSGVIMGTPGYMSPEQARGKVHDVGARSDVYSLGATLYELLTDRPLFREKDVYELLRRVVEEEPKPVRKVNPRIDADLETIVMKCLEKDAARRYGTALELAEDLARYLCGEAIEAHPSAAAYRPGLLVGIAFAAIPVLLLAGFVAYRWQQGRKPSPQPRVSPTARTETTEAVPDPSEKTRSDPERGPATVRLFTVDDGSELAYRWNRLVREIGDGGPETYAKYFKRVQDIVADTKGTPLEARFLQLHEEMLRSIQAYAEEVFTFFGDQSATLAKAGKYGEAVTAWDWFPNVIDPTGLFKDRIEENKRKTKAAGLQFYADLKKRTEESAAAGRFDEAKRLMMAALEIGFPEVTEEAFKKVAELSGREAESARKAEEESLARYEKEIRDQKETGAIVESIRACFWDLISQRKQEAAESFLKAAELFLKAERERRPGEPFAAEFKLLGEVLAGFRDLFVGVAESLKPRAGQTVTLSFVDQVRTVKLKEVGAGTIVYVMEGRELTESLWKLHASDLIKLAGADATRQAAAHLLADEFDRALDLLEGAGDRGRPLKSFIEGSSNYAAKNEAKIRERAAKFEAGREYEKAAREYSKLVAVPALRAKALKDRARAYFQAESFVAAVLDVEQLFDMDVVDRDAVDILNKSYERSALISKAIAIYEKAAKKFPEDARVLAALVGLHMKTHDYAKARQALENARKLKNWDPSLGSYVHLLNVDEKGAFPGKSYRIQLDRYIVETDVDQKFTSEIAQFMGTVYRNYKKVFPYKKNENLLFYVKIFNTESEFATYYQAVTGQPAARGFGKVGAYYMPLTKELVGWNAADLKSTLMHEGLHQFIDFYVDDCPSWFNEGFACIFETSTAEEWKFNMERHENAKYAMARKFLPSLRDLLLMSRAAWNGTDYTVFYYGQSWSFIYWLIRQGRRDILDKYFDELMKGRTGKQAFDAVFGDGKVNLDELEARWKLALFSDNYK